MRWDGPARLSGPLGSGGAGLDIVRPVSIEQMGFGIPTHEAFEAIIAKQLVGYKKSTGDLFAPAVALGLAVGRIGCFLTEQVGTATSLPWGVSVNAQAAANLPNCPQCLLNQPMHPSFLYESLFMLIAFSAMWWSRDRLTTDGLMFKLFLLSYGIFRFGVEFVRGNPDMAFGLSGSQLFLVVSIPIVLTAIVRSRSVREARSLMGATT